jgi:hypothetical protein
MGQRSALRNGVLSQSIEQELPHDDGWGLPIPEGAAPAPSSIALAGSGSVAIRDAKRTIRWQCHFCHGCSPFGNGKIERFKRICCRRTSFLFPAENFLETLREEGLASGGTPAQIPLHEIKLGFHALRRHHNYNAKSLYCKPTCTF